MMLMMIKGLSYSFIITIITTQDVRPLMRWVRCVFSVTTWAGSDSLRGIYCENVNELLTKSIFEEPCVSVEGKKEEKRGEKKNRQQMSDWLSNNVTGLISVNQLLQGIEFMLTLHTSYLCLIQKLKSVMVPREMHSDLSPFFLLLL